MTKKSVADKMRKEIKGIIPNCDVRRVRVTENGFLVFDIAESDTIQMSDMRDLCGVTFEQLYGKKCDGVGHISPACSIEIEPWVDAENDNLKDYDCYRILMSVNLLAGEDE